jgi:hypothetical protein
MKWKLLLLKLNFSHILNFYPPKMEGLALMGSMDSVTRFSPLVFSSPNPTWATDLSPKIFLNLFPKFAVAGTKSVCPFCSKQRVFSS